MNRAPDGKDPLEIREPRDGEIVRVNPNPKMRGEHTCFCLDGSWYLLSGPENEWTKDLLARSGKIIQVTMFMAANANKEFFVWPVERPVQPDHPVFIAMHHWIEIERFNEKTRCEGSVQ